MTTLARYDVYLGAGSVLRVSYPQPSVRSTLQHTNTPTNPYGGLDRFGRVVDLAWQKYGASSTTLSQIQYGYSRISNRLWRADPIAAANSKKFDELYTYDNVQRLKDMDRGELNAGKTAIVGGTLQFAQEWGLDPTANWSTFKQDDNGDGTWDLNQSRTHNTVNEITAISGGGWQQPFHPALATDSVQALLFCATDHRTNPRASAGPCVVSSRACVNLVLNQRASSRF